MEIIVGNCHCQRTCTVFLTDVRSDNFNFQVEINLKFCPQYPQTFLYRTHLLMWFTNCLNVLLERITYCRKRGRYSRPEWFSVLCIHFQHVKKVFSAPSKHNLELLSDEKNLLLVDRRVVVECPFNPSFVLMGVQDLLFCRCRKSFSFLFCLLVTLTEYFFKWHSSTMSVFHETPYLILAVLSKLFIFFTITNGNRLPWFDTLTMKPISICYMLLPALHNSPLLVMGFLFEPNVSISILWLEKLPRPWTSEFIHGSLPIMLLIWP